MGNYCLKVYLDGCAETQLVTKLQLQVSTQELHNSTTIPPSEVGLKEERDSDNNIIISDSTLRKIIPPQLKKMYEWYKIMCGCECCIYAKNMPSSLLTRRDCHLKQLKNRRKNTQNRRSGEIASRVFEIYKNYEIPHGCHTQNTTVDLATEKICSCTSIHHALPHWKCVLQCCDKYPSIVISIQEVNRDTTNTC